MSSLPSVDAPPLGGRDPARRSPRARRSHLASLLGIAVIGALAVSAAPADARPGGGNTYSGGGYSGGGGGGGYTGGGYSGGGYSGHDYSYSGGGGGGGSSSSGAAIGILLGLAIAVTVIRVIVAANNNRSITYTTAAPPAPPVTPPRPLDLSRVLEHDPDFSRVAFEDFAYRLVSAAHRARHDRGELAKLTPYLGPSALDMMANRQGRIEQVVIGSLRISRVHQNGDPPLVQLVVVVEANLAASTGTVNVAERWTFARSASTTTRPPERTHTFNCPHCNAPFRSGDSPRTCAHCGEAMEVGRFDWTVTSIRVDAETSVGPTLTGTVEEVGNDFPTLAQDDAQERLMELRTDDSNVSWDALTSRIRMIYDRLNAAWNAQELAPVRGLVTSSLLQYLQFWINEYKREGLVNRLEQATIGHLTLAKVTRDRWYDAITVRVFADGLDVTTDADGEVVGGSRESRRAYTEYWTFVRSSARRGPITTTPNCPHCGAPLAISDAGACTHCNVEIENASFDWTLSKIEQDDVYRG